MVENLFLWKAAKLQSEGKKKKQPVEACIPIERIFRLTLVHTFIEKCPVPLLKFRTAKE